MQAVFRTVLNLGISAGWLILAVVLLRLLLKKAPKRLTCLLWVPVALRLLCPVFVPSPFSLLPKTEWIPVSYEAPSLPAQTVDTDAITAQHPGTEVVVTVQQPEITVKKSVSPIGLLPYLWLTGIAAMLLYALVSAARLKRRTAASVPIRERVFACDEVPSPFIFGVFRPRICVPSSMDGETLECVLTHENAHLRRGDHRWKPLGWLLLSVYWFHPLCWLAYVLFCRDIELACDETVIRDADREGRAAYCQALLDCSFPRRSPVVGPLAFGEVGVKERVRTVLHYKKPAFWLIAAAAAVCIVTAVCFLTDPKPEFPIPEDSVVRAAVFHAEVGDGQSRELSKAQISEMVGRFSGIRRAGRSEKYAGFTPAYQLCVFLEDGSTVRASGYSFTSDMVDVERGGKRYAVRDADFAAYLQNVCLGLDVAAVQGTAEKWFDALQGDEVLWDSVREIRLPDFPGVTFRCSAEKLEAVRGGKSETLFVGMPIRNVYFFDLNGDARRELCATVSIGSGVIDERILAADYANGTVHELCDRGVYDYLLLSKNGALWAEKKTYLQNVSLGSGPLLLRPLDEGSFPVLTVDIAETPNAERPMLLMDGRFFADPYLPLSYLPHGFASAGHLSAEQAFNTGLEGIEYFTSPDEPGEFYTYQECGTPVSTNEVDSTQRQMAYLRWIPLETEALAARKLTLDDVRMLKAEKGDALTWSDFERYVHTDIGSGVYLWQFPIDSLYELRISGAGTGVPPGSIRLLNRETGAQIDVRTDDLAAFLSG